MRRGEFGGGGGWAAVAVEESVGRALSAWGLERRGVGDDARVRVVSEYGSGAACSGVCGCWHRDIRGLSHGKKPCGHERRAARAVGCDRDDIPLVGDRDADDAARCGTIEELYVLAARRPVAGDRERCLPKCRCG